MAVTYTFDVFCSLDGYGSYGDGGDWGGYWGKQGPELLEHRLRSFDDEPRMVFGATTFRDFVSMRASTDPDSGVFDPWVERMVAMPATVLSNTLAPPLDWPDATVVDGDAVEAVARLKDDSDVPLRSHGSLSLNWSGGPPSTLSSRFRAHVMQNRDQGDDGERGGVGGRRSTVGRMPEDSPDADAVATALFAAIAAGDVERVRQLYAPDVVVWHNTDRVDQGLDDNLATLGWMGRTLSDLAYQDITRSPTPTGFVQRHVLSATNRAGRRVEVPACIVADVEDGRTTHLWEYLDSAHVAELVARPDR